MASVIPDTAVEAALKAWGVGPYGWPREIVELILEAAAPHMLAEAVGSLHSWFDERMSEDHADDVVLSDYEYGHEAGITTGIKAAALKLSDRG